MRNRIIVLVLFGLAIGGMYGYYLYNKPLKDLSSGNADISIAANKLLNAFEADESLANSEYLDKIIQVSGKIEKIENTETGSSVLLDAGSLMGFISFEMAPDQDLSNYSLGDEITLRGVCSGYLMDVVLNRAVVIE